MLLKQIPEDFKVCEIYDFNSIKNRSQEEPELKKSGDKKKYYYFILTKKNYTQIRALDIIAKTFNTSRKLVYFCGTKDKVGITKQLICVYGINDETFLDNLKYFNENNSDELHLEFLEILNTRLVLGDNLGNSFEIVVRNLNGDEKIYLEEIKKTGVLNFFDEQRFGYAKNSHIVGKHILLGSAKSAVKEILTSMPDNSSSELLINFTNYVKDNFEHFAEQNIEKLNEAIQLCPRYLENEKKILEHLIKHKNDFPGAFRKIHKKLRMLYISAYQSYIFNETIIKLKEENLLENYDNLELVLSDTIYDEKIEKQVDELLLKDNLTRENFKLKSYPEFKFRQNFRDIRIFPKNIEISEFSDDELNNDKNENNENKKKLIIKFELGSGEYATNVVKQLFGEYFRL